MISFAEWINIKETNQDSNIQAAKEWLLELDHSSFNDDFGSQEDYADFVNQLSPEEIKKAVNNHYDGGWKQFIKDSQII